MKVIFSNSFFESLKKLKRHSTWWYKTYEFFRRDIWMFLNNIWYFRKELYKHRNWDSYYTLRLMHRSLCSLLEAIEKYSLEVDEYKNPKIEKIKRAIELLDWHINDSFIELAEKELGIELKIGDFTEIIKVSDEERKVFNRANELEAETWKELMKILKGQDSETIKLMGHDGSGIKGWWY